MNDWYYYPQVTLMYGMNDHQTEPNPNMFLVIGLALLWIVLLTICLHFFTQQDWKRYEEESKSER